MIRSNEEFYLVIDKIINTLRTTLYEKEANDLHDALTISTIPGEIMGELRITLKTINKKVPKKHNMKLVSDALSYLNGIL